jgi:hypothetical protein
VLELAAKVAHVDVKVLLLRGIARTPDVLEQLLIRQNAAGLVRERGQELVLDRRQPDFAACHRDDPAREVDSKVAKSKGALLLGVDLLGVALATRMRARSSGRLNGFVR